MEVTQNIQANAVLFPDANLYCLVGNTLEYVGNRTHTSETSAEFDRKNIEALLGVFKDDLLNGGNFFNELRKYAFRKTRDFQLAEDAVADFYCNTVRKVRDGVLSYRYPVDREKGIDGNPKIVPWAYACVNNSCKDSYRRRHSGINRKISSRYDLSEGHLPDLKEDGEESVLKKELKQVISQGMEHLSKPHSEVIQLCYFHGLRYGEIAEVLGIPLGTVKSRMHAALIDLRKILSYYKSN